MQSPCSHMPITLPASNKTPTIILDILYKIDMHVSKLILPRNLRGLKKCAKKYPPIGNLPKMSISSDISKCTPTVITIYI